MKVAPSTDQHVSMWHSIAFGVTDLMGGGYGALVGAYLMFFFTTFCNLNPLEAGSIIGLAKVIDIVTSVVMGKLSDSFWKTKLGTKYGRRHFFLLIGSPMILIVYFLLWLPDVALGYWYYLIIYCLVEIVVTMILIPYETLPSEMTTDFNERSKMSTTRMFFSGAITSIVTIVGGTVISLMGDKNAYAYTVIGGIFAVTFAIAVFITYKFTWERPLNEIAGFVVADQTPQKTERHSIKDVIKALWGAIVSYCSTLKVKAFRQHLYLYLVGVTAQDFFSLAFVYFIVFGNNSSTATASWLLSFGIVGLPLAPVNYWLFTRLGARWDYVLNFGVTVLGLIAYYIVYMMNLRGPAFIITMAIVSIIYLYFKGGAYSIPWNVFPYIPDVDEIMTCQRREGEFAAVMTFMRKLTSGIASIIGGWILATNGFKTGSLTQPPEAVHAITNVVIWIPAALTFVAILIALTFNLNKSTHKVLVDEINRLKKGGKKDEVTPKTKRVVESLTGIKYSKVWPLEKSE